MPGPGATDCNDVPGTGAASFPGRTEVLCNGVDDNCNGSADDTVCPISGQTCTSGTCACAPGSVICGGRCQARGASCAPGIGECRRTGTMECNSAGMIACNVVAAAPASETCNNRDDNCNGAVDEGSLCGAGSSCVNGGCRCNQVCVPNSTRACAMCGGPIPCL
ncbi:MAG: hypothetical protein IPF99_34175 [Deltaproteobacteria bacterium]|nr:hypothetical protein [Deltaproteobacteria bacterium]